MDEKSSSKSLVFETLRLYWQAAARHKKELTLSFFLPVGVVLFSIAVPFYASKVLAGIVQQSGGLEVYLIPLAIYSLAGVTANRIGFKYNMALQARTMSDLSRLVFERLLSRSTGFHANRVSGKLVSDATEFVTAFSLLTNAGFITGLSFAVSIVVGIIIVAINSWLLGLVIAAIVAAILVWAIFDSRQRSRLRSTRLVATKKLTSHLSDSIVNAQTVKTFAQEAAEMQRNEQLNKRLESLRVRDWQRAGRNANNRMTALLAMQFGMILLVIHLTRANPAILATGIFAFTYTLTLTNRLFEVNTLLRQVEEALMQAEPVTAMLRETVEIQDKPNAGKLSVKNGGIVIKDMSFAYPENVRNGAVFEHFDLSVRSGERIGLVGPSGGGKSTLTRLLLRFDDVQSGAILIDDQNIAEITQDSLRAAIAYVPQEPLLFHRSISENIAYGKPEASKAAVVEAAKRAKAHEFIKALPEGYETVVGERGVKLSGGQRQRVAIARAILKNAPILILDEATSALDSENEIQVQKALWELMKGRTTIVIAHRLSTIQKMDRIIVLNDGKIVEEGSHKKLLAKKALYAQLWSHQSGGFIEE